MYKKFQASGDYREEEDLPYYYYYYIYTLQFHDPNHTFGFDPWATNRFRCSLDLDLREILPTNSVQWPEGIIWNGVKG